jgi:beta-mannosidase
MTDQTKQIHLKWELGYSDDLHSTPAEFIPAAVPGAVQLDIARAKQYPDYLFSDNFKLFGWMENRYYTYRAFFEKPQPVGNEALYFVSKGIDYRFEIFLNGTKLLAQEGMFTHVELDLTGLLQNKNRLEIKICPIPKRNTFPENHTQASASVKPAVSYGWDWHPRLVPLGIWDDTFLEFRPLSHLSDVYVAYRLADDFSEADITLHASAKLQSECNYEWKLIDEQQKTCIELSGQMQTELIARCVLPSPQLWWTHDHGKPYLYHSVFTLKDLSGNTISENKQKTGFRRIRLVTNEGAWDNPEEFPKTQSAPPAQIELNGRNIFAKGTNWVNPEIFPGTITVGRYEELLKIAVNANFNILRSWGGAIVNKESFFRLCDESGILVWQEFPLACNQYPDDEHYLSILKQEATSIIVRLRKHPCLAIWCGGNELFNSWSKMTNQSLPLRLLNSLCLEHDPATPFIPTSPLFGMGHGNYVFRWKNEEVFQTINKSRHTAYSEFGISGTAPREALEKIIPPDELFPPRKGTAWETHHAIDAWESLSGSWLCPSILTEYFGEAKTLDELIAQSQLLQSEGYKAIYEEARRQKPYCSMALNWCYNEPWPAAANNSLLVYPAIPKPALAAVRNSCRPICASARFDKFVWTEGEIFTAGIWLLNDTFAPVESKTILLKLRAEENKQIIIFEQKSEMTEANQNLKIADVSYQLPAWKHIDRFQVTIEILENPEYNSEYILLYHLNH